MTVTGTRRKGGLVFLFLGSVIFLLIGVAWRRIALVEMGDFKVVYYSARCLLEHGDPYNQHDVERVYDREKRERVTEPALDRQVKTRFFYPPTVFALTVPVVSLGYEGGAIAWTILLAGGMILAAFAICDLGADLSPTAAGVLAGLILMNSFWLYMIGNAAGIAVSLCVIAIWTFYRQRFVGTGVLFLAMSLAVKPNDSGLIWLLLILWGGAYRKRAIQALLALMVIAAAMLLWISQVAPRWLSELRANMASFSGIGGIVDPAATGMAGRNMDPLVQLQTVTSIFFARAPAFDIVAGILLAPLALIWLWTLLPRKQASDGLWLALAVAAPLTLLPTYHFQHDGKLLLLAIPGCVLLWARRGPAGWTSVLLTGAAIVVNGDIFTALKVSLFREFVIPQPGIAGGAATILLTRPSALVLLAMAVFFLWALVRDADTVERSRESRTDGQPERAGREELRDRRAPGVSTSSTA